MKGLLSLMMAAVFAAFPLVAATEMPTRLDVTTQPDGAQIFIDGTLRGTSPMQIFDIQPGRHLVHVQASGYRSADEFVVVREGDFIQKNWSLAHEKALFLLRTNPEGAEVRYNGVALGHTPYLGTTFNVGETYALELLLNGYKTRKIVMRLDGRTPVVRDEDLMTDSGIVKCVTDPAGATVLVNGVERGVTPLVADSVPKGLAIVTFRLNGYREETRELRLAAGEERSLEIKLSAKTATLKVLSTPEKARVFVDGDYQGKTPIEAVALKPGEHKLKLELAGYGTVEKTIYAEKGDDVTENIALDSVLGRLQVRTIPGGAKILLDGHAVGTTKEREGAVRSDVLVLNDIQEGDHSIVAHKDGYQDATKRIKLNPKQILDVNMRLNRIFLADTEVETVHGTYRGMLVSANSETIILEIRPGIMQTIRQGDVRSKKSLR